MTEPRERGTFMTELGEFECWRAHMVNCRQFALQNAEGNYMRRNTASLGSRCVPLVADTKRIDEAITFSVERAPRWSEDNNIVILRTNLPVAAGAMRVVDSSDGLRARLLFDGYLHVPAPSRCCGQSAVCQRIKGLAGGNPSIACSNDLETTLGIDDAIGYQTIRLVPQRPNSDRRSFINRQTSAPMLNPGATTTPGAFPTSISLETIPPTGGSVVYPSTRHVQFQEPPSSSGLTHDSSQGYSVRRDWEPPSSFESSDEESVL